MIAAIMPLVICSCSPVVPGNYMGPTSMQSAQKVKGCYVQPRVIRLSNETFNTTEGRALLEPAMKPQPYRIGSFDNLNIIVWGHPDISTVATGPSPATLMSNALGSSMTPMMATSSANPAVQVQSDGTMFYPYVGHIKVEGMTLYQVQDVITRRLSKYIRNPQVTVQVAKYRNRHVYVLGEVNMPGMQALSDKPLSLMEAISMAGDIRTTTADPSHIYLVRGSFSRPDVYWLNAQTPQSLLIAEQFPLQENDIVYVSAASLTGLNNFINQILPSLSTYTIARGLANS